MRLPDGARLRDREKAFAALDLVVRRHVDGLLQGDHAGVRLGPGGDPAEVVRYLPGEDDVRRIDWNVTARSAEPHVWRSRADHELDTWLLVDATASMDFGTTTLEKRDLGAWTAAIVALLSDGPGNRVGVARHTADGLRWEKALPPGSAPAASPALPRRRCRPCSRTRSRQRNRPPAGSPGCAASARSRPPPRRPPSPPFAPNSLRSSLVSPIRSRVSSAGSAAPACE